MLSLSEFFGSPDLAAPSGSLAVLTGMFALILCRVSAVVMVAPGLGESGAPMRIRAGLCLGITLALLPVLQPRLGAVSGEALRMPAMALKLVAGELLCGAFLGMLARLLALSLPIAGQIIAVFTGMASVIQTDSQLGASSTAVSHMTSALAPIILFSTGLYALPLMALCGSYALFPAGHVTSMLVGDMAADVTRAVSASFLIAMQLAAPYLLLGTLWPAMLGVLNRLMPSIQVYSLAIPAQILGGILLMALLVQILTSTWTETMQLHLSTLPGLTAPATPCPPMAEENGSGGGEKTQAPTEKRLQKAREDGNIAQSKELLILVALGSFLLVFALAIPASARRFLHEIGGVFINFGVASSDPASLYALSFHAFTAGLTLIGPLMATGTCAILLGGILQTGFLFRPQALKPDITRLSPLKGIKRIISLNNLIEMLKTLAKITVFGLILYKVAAETVALAPQTERWTPYQLVTALKSWFIYAGFMVLAIQCAITGLDEVWSRYHRLSKLRMSLQDIKDEMKQSEGDPQVKGRLRQLRQSRSRRRMMQAVKEATVIIVNPTHYAVAILYDRTSHAAPQIVAKGMDELAFRIRDVARGMRIPVITNPPLARALHTLPLDSEIPEEFWKPVAAIIAYVVRLKTPGSRASRPQEGQ